MENMDIKIKCECGKSFTLHDADNGIRDVVCPHCRELGILRDYDNIIGVPLKTECLT